MIIFYINHKVLTFTCYKGHLSGLAFIWLSESHSNNSALLFSNDLITFFILFLTVWGTLSSALLGGSTSLGGENGSQANMLSMRGPAVIHGVFGTGYGGIVRYGGNLISAFQRSFASVSKISILVGRLAARLLFYKFLRLSRCFLWS